MHQRPGVTPGYWNLPERSESAYLVDSSGKRWYKTGDIVVMDSDGNFIYVGRRDRMVKKRGYRIELGEIEACLYQHQDLKEVGAIAITDGEGDVKIKVFVSALEGRRPSIIALKKFCSDRLQQYMIPDFFVFQKCLPRTSTGKIDYQLLKGMDT